MKKITMTTLGGGLAGLVLGLIPFSRHLSEIRNFQIFLVEMSYQLLTRFLPAKAMRALSTSWAELIILAAIGALIGLGIGVVIYAVAIPLSRRDRIFSPLTVSFCSTVGAFMVLFGILWCRIVIIHSSTRRMVSPEGISMILGSLLIGTLVGMGLMLVFRWLSRYRLEKVFLFGPLAALFAFNVPSLFSQVIPTNAPAGGIPTIRQIVLLGVDGATWDIALPMIRQGKLPHLKRLMERGGWGDIRTTIPWKSPILWTSIATGKREEDHGIHDFVVRDPEGKNVLPLSVASRKVKAVWDIASEAGRSVDVVNWYGSWPAESVNGLMLSKLFMRENVSERIFPPDRVEEIDSLMAGLEAQGIPRNEEMVAEVGLRLLEKDRPELFLLYLREIDDAQHFYWKYHAVRTGSWLARWLYGPVEPAEVAQKGDRIEEAYQRLDAALGKILKLAGPGTLIMLVSDHGAGIKSARGLRFDLNPLLQRWSLLRYLPEGKAIDWQETKIYDATKRPWYEKRELFINRRPEGPFGAGLREEEEREFLNSVVERLRMLKTDLGKPLVTKVWVEDPPGEVPHIAVRVNVRLPENELNRGKSLGLPLSEVVWSTPLTGTHRLNGILALAGPGIKAGYRLRAASILDVTPTVLYLLGLPIGDDMEGRVLLEALEPSLIQAKPVKVIPSYETGSTRQGLGGPRATAVDEELLDELHSLGYIQ